MSSEDLKFKGYAIHDCAKWTEFKVIDFEPKRFEDYDVEIKINCCGICSSDVHTIMGPQGWGEPSVMPLITGHEIAGVVTRVGSKVTEFKAGDRAGVGAQVWSCMECDNCKSGKENYCPKMVDTYNSRFPNGDIAHGGYSTGVRAHEQFVFKLPDGLEDADAAPMLCGGLTVFGPLKNHNVGKGSKVAIVGIGGLGHFAVQFATALGAEVTAFSHQADKEKDVREMGAKEFVLTSKKGFAEDYAQKFDLVLSTVDNVAGLPMADLVSMVKVFGVFHTVGLPDKPVEVNFASMAGNAASIAVSHLGNKNQANEMLALAAEKGVKTWKQILPMSQAGQGVQDCHDNKVRYRTVLKVDI